MEENKKEQGKIIVVSQELKAKMEAGGTPTPYEECVMKHAGQCGTCSQTGGFTQCA